MPAPSATDKARICAARIALAAVAAACLATSRPTMRRNYPSWQLKHLGERKLACTRFDAYVKKSGKTGVGIVLAFRPERTSCAIAVLAAGLDIGGERVPASALPMVSGSSGPQFVYLAFPFDNETAWNEERTRGSFHLKLSVGGRIERLAFPMKHRWGATHVSERDLGQPAPSRSHTPGQPTSTPLVPAAPEPTSPEFAEPPPGP